MAFRDPLEAARARIEALEAELGRLREAEAARIQAEADLEVARQDAAAREAIGELETQRQLVATTQAHEMELTRLRMEHEIQRAADREEIATLRARCEALEEQVTHLRDELARRAGAEELR